MKKTLMYSMVLALIMVALSGCGSSSNGGNDNGSNTAAPSNNTSGNNTNNAGEVKEPEKIKFYTFKAKRDTEPYVIAVNKFNELHDDIEVEYVELVQNNDSVEFMNKLDILMAGGEEVDVIHPGNVDMLLERAARGVIEPLDDYFAADNVNPDEEFKFNPRLDGKLYGMNVSASQLLVAFNKDHLDAAGLPLPEMGWTWDDFREYAKAMTTPEHYGAYFHMWGEFPNTIAYNELPHPQLNEDLTLAFDHPSYKYFFELRRAMEKEDKSVEPHADVLASNYHILQQFFAGKASMLPVGTYIINATTMLDRFPHDFKTVYAPMPRSSADAEMGYTQINGNFMAMSANSKHKEAGYTFMKWMATEGNQYLQDIPGWKKADGEALLKEFYGNAQDLIDLPSLTNALFHPEIKSPGYISVPYSAQLKTVVENTFNAYILDDLSFEEAQQMMFSEGEKVIK